MSAKHLQLPRLRSVCTPRNPQAARGIVRIGVGEIVAMSWFADFMAELKRTMPNVVYEIEVDLTFNMRQKLELGKLDLAITAESVDRNRLTSDRRGATWDRQRRPPSLEFDQAQTTGLFSAYHPPTCAAKAASTRLRFNFIVGVRNPFSIDHGSRATTSI